MQASENCIAFIKSKESFRARPYRCPAGILTIGYGTTDDVKESDVWTEKQADLALRAHVRQIEAEIKPLFHVAITAGMFDACVSLVYNIGAYAFARSTLLGAINHGDFKFAAAQFDRWIRAGARVLPGLVARRQAERAWFEAGVCSSLPKVA